jgi:ATP-dependent Lhr-like helicase
MRVYVKEEPLSQAAHPLDALRRSTVQAVAMLELMLERWNEPPEPGRLHLSTLVHQLLALIVQHGGITASRGWQLLCASGVFDAVDRELYLLLLRRMGHPDVGLIEQAPDGTLLPGPAGERIAQGRDFYAVFMGGEEYRVVEVGGRNIGTVPESQPYIAGQLLMLAGRRWRIQEVDGARKEISVVRAYGGQPPIFGGDPVPPSEGVVRAMRRTYETIAVPTFLDKVAIGLLREARESFDYLGLRNGSVCRHGDSLLIFPWAGARRQTALLLALTRVRLEPVQLGLAISVPEAAAAKLRSALAELAAAPPPDPLELARLVEDKACEKYDPFLDDDLLCRAYASERIDASALPALAGEVLAKWLPEPSGVDSALPPPEAPPATVDNGFIDRRT